MLFILAVKIPNGIEHKILETTNIAATDEGLPVSGASTNVMTKLKNTEINNVKKNPLKILGRIVLELRPFSPTSFRVSTEIVAPKMPNEFEIRRAKVKYKTQPNSLKEPIIHKSNPARRVPPLCPQILIESTDTLKLGLDEGFPMTVKSRKIATTAGRPIIIDTNCEERLTFVK